MELVKKGRVVAVVVCFLVGLGGVQPTPAHAALFGLYPPTFSVTPSKNSILVKWNLVVGASKYQVRIRKTSQKSSAGYVFTLPNHRLDFRLKKSHRPDLKRPGAYVITVCATNGRTRQCSAQGLKPRVRGKAVSGTRPDRAAHKANQCLRNGAAAAITTGASATLQAMFIPGAGQVTAATIAGTAVIAGGVTYVWCAITTAGNPAIDDYMFLSSAVGGFGGSGGGGGGGGTWRTPGGAR